MSKSFFDLGSYITFNNDFYYFFREEKVKNLDSNPFTKPWSTIGSYPNKIEVRERNDNYILHSELPEL